MSFTPEQNAELAAPLARSAVKGRKQGGRTVSYIEGWHAIAEANRIFGFDGWWRTTVDIKCVAEHERAIGNEGAQGWGVSYIARVKITVLTGEDGTVIREGVGAGHGIDRDLGLAHESAVKEAETDAMKRALMTFGNPFGLALYDKTQEGVEAPERPVQRQERPTAPPQRNGHESPPQGSALEASPIRDAMLKAVGSRGTEIALNRMLATEDWLADYNAMDAASKRVLDNAVEHRRQQLARAA